MSMTNSHPRTLQSLNWLLREIPCNDVCEQARFIGYRDDGWGNTIRIVIIQYVEYYDLPYNFYVNLSSGGNNLYTNSFWSELSIETLADLIYVNKGMVR
ncbi:MAG: hypothetical protein RSC93_02180 [Erysipelotrichaceae bacterium]